MNKHLFVTLLYKINTFSLLLLSNTTTCLISVLHSRWDICFLLFSTRLIATCVLLFAGSIFESGIFLSSLATIDHL